MKKVCFILLFPFIIQFIMACGKCEATHLGTYTHHSLQIKNIRFNADNSNMDSIPALEYGFIMDIELKKLANNFSFPDALLHQKAFAWQFEDCITDDLNAADTIKALKIYSTASFNNDFPAGKDLSELFMIGEETVQEYIAKDPNRLIIMKSNAGQDNYLTAIFRLSQKTETEGWHTFNVEIICSDNRILTAQTSVYLTH